MTLESGKPLVESKGEIAYGTSFLDFYAAEAIRSTGAGGGFVCPSPFASGDGSPRYVGMFIIFSNKVRANVTSRKEGK